MSDTEIFMRAATEIGSRLVQQAIWRNASCTWSVMVPDPASPWSGRGVRTEASGNLYQGTAGVALFLAELYKRTQDAEFRRTALGAMSRALSECTNDISRIGFFTGAVGIGYAAIRVGDILEEPKYAQSGIALLERVSSSTIADRALDVIAGSAGVIPIVLSLAGRIGTDFSVSWAVRLGNHLLRTAHFEPIGWSWHLMRYRCRRNPTGLAHGAAGVGAALLELAHVTGQAEFSYAARQAFLYERQFFDPVQENWPDFRHFNIEEFFSGTLDQVRERLLRDGPPAPEPPRYQTTWCHGAVGIGLTRLRAYELTGERTYLREADAAVRTTISTMREPNSGWSLCHGFSANCELLGFAGRLLQDGTLQELAKSRLLAGIELHGKGGSAWPSGNIGGLPDPSLMLGDSGVGYTLLRFLDPSIPSILLPAPANARTPHISTDLRSEALRRDYVAGYFGRTLEVLRRVDGVEPAAAEGVLECSGDIAATLAAIELRIARESDAKLRMRLRDALCVDRECHRLTLEIDDFMDEAFHKLSSPPEEALTSPDALISLAPDSRFLQTDYDWTAWALSESQGDPGGDPSPCVWLLYRMDNRMHARRLSPFAELVLRSVSEHGSATVGEIIGSVRAHAAGGLATAVEALEKATMRQLEEALAAGILTVQREEIGLVRQDASWPASGKPRVNPTRHDLRPMT